MHIQLNHEDERRWVMVLAQLELDRIESFAVGTVERLKCGELYNQAGELQASPTAALLAVA